MRTLKGFTLACVLTLCWTALLPIKAAEQALNNNCQKGQWVCNAPIILPLTDKRELKREDYKLTGPIGGVRFDLDGDDIEEQTAWTALGSHLAFLALDRNGNGKIDNGKELFGNNTYTELRNGFAALNREANYKGMVSEGHPLYEKLLLWEDANHNGISEQDEIHKFSDEYVGIDGGYQSLAGRGESPHGLLAARRDGC